MGEVSRVAALLLVMACIPTHGFAGERMFHCSFDGGAVSFTVSFGDRQEVISAYSGGPIRRGYAASFGTPLAWVLSKGRQTDTYVLDLPTMRFTHVHTDFVDGPDKPPFMVVQGGSCTSG